MEEIWTLRKEKLQEKLKLKHICMNSYFRKMP